MEPKWVEFPIIAHCNPPGAPKLLPVVPPIIRAGGDLKLRGEYLSLVTSCIYTLIFYQPRSPLMRRRRTNSAYLLYRPRFHNRRVLGEGSNSWADLSRQARQR